MNRGLALFCTLLLIITFFSCRQQHWQRSKVRVRQPVKKPTIEVDIINKRNYLFTEAFNNNIKTICEKEFARMGYSLHVNDTPDFKACVKIDMDSFASKAYYKIGTGGTGYIWRLYRRDKVYALLFDYSIINARNKQTKWEEKNDIYFFDNTRKDSRRSRSMIKYTIRYGK